MMLGLFLFILVGNSLTANSTSDQDYKIPIETTYVATPTSSPTPTTSPSPTPTITPVPTFTPTPTLTPTPTPEVTAPVSLEDLFEKYSSQYNVDKNLLKKIADCESGFNPNATNSDYAGLFQFATSTWATARGRMELGSDPNLRFNPEEAIKTAAFEINAGGTSPWSNCD